jgi:hypothetical protein
MHVRQGFAPYGYLTGHNAAPTVSRQFPVRV